MWLDWLIPSRRRKRRNEAAYCILRIGPVRFTKTAKRTWDYPRQKQKADNMAQNQKQIITDEQEVQLAVEFRTQAGNPAKIDGAPVWTATGPVEILPDPDAPSDEFKKLLRRTGELGVFQVSVKGDANLDPTVNRDIILIADGEVVAAEAVGGQVTFGAPRVVTP